jgi:hypothetical protein
MCLSFLFAPFLSMAQGSKYIDTEASLVSLQVQDEVRLQESEVIFLEHVTIT